MIIDKLAQIDAIINSNNFASLKSLRKSILESEEQHLKYQLKIVEKLKTETIYGVKLK